MWSRKAQLGGSHGRGNKLGHRNLFLFIGTLYSPLSPTLSTLQVVAHPIRVCTTPRIPTQARALRRTPRTPKVGALQVATQPSGSRTESQTITGKMEVTVRDGEDTVDVDGCYFVQGGRVCVTRAREGAGALPRTLEWSGARTRLVVVPRYGLVVLADDRELHVVPVAALRRVADEHRSAEALRSQPYPEVDTSSSGARSVRVALQHPEERIGSVAVNSDARCVAVSTTRLRVLFYSLASLQRVYTLPREYAWLVQWSPTAPEVAVVMARETRCAYLLGDALRGDAPKPAVRLSDEPVTAAAFSDDGGYCAVASGRQHSTQVAVWQVADDAAGRPGTRQRARVALPADWHGRYVCALRFVRDDTLVVAYTAPAEEVPDEESEDVLQFATLQLVGLEQSANAAVTRAVFTTLGEVCATFAAPDDWTRLLPFVTAAPGGALALCAVATSDEVELVGIAEDNQQEEWRPLRPPDHGRAQLPELEEDEPARIVGMEMVYVSALENGADAPPDQRRSVPYALVLTSNGLLHFFKLHAGGRAADGEWPAPLPLSDLPELDAGRFRIKLEESSAAAVQPPPPVNMSVFEAPPSLERSTVRPDTSTSAERPGVLHTFGDRPVEHTPYSDAAPAPATTATASPPSSTAVEALVRAASTSVERPTPPSAASLQQRLIDEFHAIYNDLASLQHQLQVLHEDATVAWRETRCEQRLDADAVNRGVSEALQALERVETHHEAVRDACQRCADALAIMKMRQLALEQDVAALSAKRDGRATARHRRFDDDGEESLSPTAEHFIRQVRTIGRMEAEVQQVLERIQLTLQERTQAHATSAAWAGGFESRWQAWLRGGEQLRSMYQILFRCSFAAYRLTHQWEQLERRQRQLRRVLAERHTPAARLSLRRLRLTSLSQDTAPMADSDSLASTSVVADSASRADASRRAIITSRLRHSLRKLAMVDGRAAIRPARHRAGVSEATAGERRRAETREEDMPSMAAMPAARAVPKEAPRAQQKTPSGESVVGVPSGPRASPQETRRDIASKTLETRTEFGEAATPTASKTKAPPANDSMAAAGEGTAKQTPGMERRAASAATVTTAAVTVRSEASAHSDGERPQPAPVAKSVHFADPLARATSAAAHRAPMPGEPEPPPLRASAVLPTKPVAAAAKPKTTNAPMPGEPEPPPLRASAVLPTKPVAAAAKPKTTNAPMPGEPEPPPLRASAVLSSARQTEPSPAEPTQTAAADRPLFSLTPAASEKREETTCTTSAPKKAEPTPTQEDGEAPPPSVAQPPAIPRAPMPDESDSPPPPPRVFMSEALGDRARAAMMPHEATRRETTESAEARGQTHGVTDTEPIADTESRVGPMDSRFALDHASTPSFGQPTPFGAMAAPAFGAPSAIGNASFGSSTPFGSGNATAFGAPSPIGFGTSVSSPSSSSSSFGQQTYAFGGFAAAGGFGQMRPSGDSGFAATLSQQASGGGAAAGGFGALASGPSTRSTPFGVPAAPSPSAFPPPPSTANKFSSPAFTQRRA